MMIWLGLLVCCLVILGLSWELVATFLRDVYGSEPDYFADNDADFLRTISRGNLTDLDEARRQRLERIARNQDWRVR